MRILPLVVSVLVSVSASHGSAEAADGWRCGTRLVGVGDFAIDVRAACGAPMAIERRTRTQSIREVPPGDHPSAGKAKAPAGTSVRTVKPRIDAWSSDPSPVSGDRGAVDRVVTHLKTSEIEEWSYRSNSGELLRTLIFEDGRLVAIQIGGRRPVDPSRCERQLFPLGSTSAELRLTCGEPAQEDSWVELLETQTQGGVVLGRSITRERWVYNFGPDRFLRIFELAEGRLIEQRTGGYGFTP